MAVRKAVLEYLREELPDNQNKEEVRHLVLKKRDQLEQIILDTLKPYGTKPFYQGVFPDTKIWTDRRSGGNV